jgi:hypothetical protein
MQFRRLKIVAAAVGVVVIAGAAAIWFNLKPTEEDDAAIASACADIMKLGMRKVADQPTERFLGKVEEARARCRGGDRAVAYQDTPWVDWANYWGTGDASSKSDRFGPGSHIFNRAQRGVDGALLDLEYQRMELIKFNLFDNSGTYQEYLGADGQTRKMWPEMRLPKGHPSHGALQVEADGKQLCQGDLIRFRTVTGICNDIRNPAMGSTGMPFARNVAFESTFPELGLNELARNRHGDRIGLLKPDPQVISRKLFTRDQTNTPNCNKGRGLPGSKDADCDYRKAPFFNVLAAFWIQFMTHDWFSHLKDARNDQSNMLTNLGCATERVGNEIVPLSPERAAALGCRPNERMDAALFAKADPPETFKHDRAERLKRAYKTTPNLVTAWWDASQIYGWDETSRRRVKRDPKDRAKLLLVESGKETFLPTFRRECAAAGADQSCEPMQPEWAGQEVTAFPDNWSLGLSFYHNVFAREHNAIIDEFRRVAKAQPDTDSGLRNPRQPDKVITYSQITDDELFEIARLIVAAEIAKIHTIEWTAQLLYNEPLYVGMNSNWSGVFERFPLAAEVSERLVNRLVESGDPHKTNQLYSAFAAGGGIFGRASRRKFPPYLPEWLSWDEWSITSPDHVNGGTNHFGSPFNFPEDFPSVYRLHSLVPDMLEYRDVSAGPNAIQERLPIVETFRGKASDVLHKRGLANVGLSMGRQRLGLLLLRNHPQFLQNLDLRPRIDSTIDVAALDLVRDRERGTPRFNEFRRQIGLRQLTSFDDFIDVRLPKDSPERAYQEELVKAIREVYGQHRCDAAKIITDAQRDKDGKPINDCLGHPDGTMVDNIEDLDLVVGFHAETTRPHGFAISETQFHIFILNASRRLFSDRFFTSSFRPEFYTKLGVEWVMNNGPTGKQWAGAGARRQRVRPVGARPRRVLLAGLDSEAGRAQRPGLREASIQRERSTVTAERGGR